MKKLLSVFIMVAIFAGINVLANTEKKNKQTKCPICKMEVKKDIHTDYMGERIYFCNKGCMEKFNKDPKKYMEQMKKDGVVCEKTEAKEKVKAENKKKPSCAGLPCEATCGKK